MTEFDFPRWRDWLGAKAIELRSVHPLVLCTRHEVDVRSCALEIEAGFGLGSFVIWENGLADFAVWDGKGEGLEPWQSGIEVNNQSVSAVFEMFLNEFERVRSCG